MRIVKIEYTKWARDERYFNDGQSWVAGTVQATDLTTWQKGQVVTLDRGYIPGQGEVWVVRGQRFVSGEDFVFDGEPGIYRVSDRLAKAFGLS